MSCSIPSTGPVRRLSGRGGRGRLPSPLTYEGAAQPQYDPDAKKFNFSVKPIARDDNQAGDLILKSFYAKNRIIDGLEDGFIVKIVA